MTVSDSACGDRAIDTAIEVLSGGGAVLTLDEMRGISMVGAAANGVAEEWVNFMLGRCRGPLYVALERDRLHRLGIPPDIGSARSRNHFVPVDLSTGVTTGISVADRTRTIRALASAAPEQVQFHAPGHVASVALHEGGILARPRVPEALSALLRAGGGDSSVLFAAVLDESGAIAPVSHALAFAETHGLPVIAVNDVVRWLRRLDGVRGSRDDIVDLDLIDSGVRLTVLLRQETAPGTQCTVQLLSACLRAEFTGDRCGCAARVRDALAGSDDTAPDEHRIVALWWHPKSLTGACARNRAGLIDLGLDPGALRDFVAAFVTGGRSRPEASRLVASV